MTSDNTDDNNKNAQREIRPRLVPKPRSRVSGHIRMHTIRISNHPDRFNNDFLMKILVEIFLGSFAKLMIFYEKFHRIRGS